MSQEHDAAMVRSKLRKALDNIGKNNGHAVPKTDSNIDPILHELFIASEASSYFKKRFDLAKVAALEACTAPDEVQEIIDRVIKADAGETNIVGNGDLYMLELGFNKPSNTLNKVELKSCLQVDYGLSRDDVNKAFEDCSHASTPAKRLKAIPR